MCIRDSSQFPGLSAPAKGNPKGNPKGSPLGSRADRPDATSVPAPSAALVQHLDHLAHDIMTTPGAGGALIAAYAAQARALSMVVEAARRAGTGPMPASVIAAVQEALAAPSPFPRPMAG